MPTNVSFYYGSTLPTASSTYVGALFFASDTGKISRGYSTTENNNTTYGWVDYGGASGVIIKTDTGDISSGQSQDKLYVNLADSTIKSWNGTSWVTIAKAPRTSIRASGSASDDEIPSEAAVRAMFGTSSGQAPLLGTGGKLSDSVIPSVAISEFMGTFHSLTELTTAAADSNEDVSGAEKGDYVIINHTVESEDTNNSTGSEDGTYVFYGSSRTTADDWKRISTPDTNTTYSGGEGITVSGGSISLNAADSTHLGGVKINGNNLSIDGNGVLSATDTWRPVQVSGTAITTGDTLNIAGGGIASVAATRSGTTTTVTVSANLTWTEVQSQQS